MTFNGTRKINVLMDIEKPIMTPIQCYHQEMMVMWTRRVVAEMGRSVLNLIYLEVETIGFGDDYRGSINNNFQVTGL